MLVLKRLFHRKKIMHSTQQSDHNFMAMSTCMLGISVHERVTWQDFEMEERQKQSLKSWFPGLLLYNF